MIGLGSVPGWMVMVAIAAALLLGFLLGHERRVYRSYRDVDLIGARSTVEEWAWAEPPTIALTSRLRLVGEEWGDGSDEPKDAA